MTSCPYRIDIDAAVADAQNVMSLNQVRHLPVVERGEVFGIISENDIRLGVCLRSDGDRPLVVGEICSRNPFVVNSSAPIAEVVKSMADRKIDCTLVADDDDNFVGIFTTTDACRLVYRLLDESAAE